MSKRMSMDDMCNTDKSTYIVHETLRPPPFTIATARSSRRADRLFVQPTCVQDRAVSVAPCVLPYPHRFRTINTNGKRRCIVSELAAGGI
jgi:hypothetical protein